MKTNQFVTALREVCDSNDNFTMGVSALSGDIVIWFKNDRMMEIGDMFVTVTGQYSSMLINPDWRLNESCPEKAQDDADEIAEALYKFLASTGEMSLGTALQYKI